VSAFPVNAPVNPTAVTAPVTANAPNVPTDVIPVYAPAIRDGATVPVANADADKFVRFAPESPAALRYNALLCVWVYASVMPYPAIVVGVFRIDDHGIVTSTNPVVDVAPRTARIRPVCTVRSYVVPDRVTHTRTE